VIDNLKDYILLIQKVLFLTVLISLEDIRVG